MKNKYEFKLWTYTNSDYNGNFVYTSTHWNMSLSIDSLGHYCQIGLLVKPTDRQIRQFKKAGKVWMMSLGEDYND